jgi:cytochrome c oxidase subunit 1
MPSPSYWPLVVSLGLPVIGFGVIYNHLLIAAGGLIVLLGAFGWVMEPSTAPPSEYEPPTGDTPAEPSGELVKAGES